MSSSGIPINQNELVRAVGVALGHDFAGPLEYVTDFLGGGAAASNTVGAWRVTEAAPPGVAPRWSMVLKVLRHSENSDTYWPSSRDPSDPMYWRREVDAYESGLLSSFAGGFRAAAPYGAFLQSDGSYNLWCEDVQVSQEKSGPWLITPSQRDSSDELRESTSCGGSCLTRLG